MDKEYFVFAGVNGAGKSTLYNQYPHIPQKRINSDEILRKKGGDWKNSADLAIQRVNQRVSGGGHGIPEEDIRRRYEQSLKNLKEIIPLCDKVEIYDNTDSFSCVACYKNGQLEIKQNCEWLDRALQSEIEELSKNDLGKREEHFSMSDWKNAVERPLSNARILGFDRQIGNSVEMDERE